MSKKYKDRKPPTMPKWFWYSVMDGCWCCKDKNRCNNCGLVKKYRKEFFESKQKGKNYNKTKKNKMEK